MCFVVDFTLNISNCIIANNAAHDGGGISIINNANVVIINSIIRNNYASDDGGGIFIRFNANAQIYNSVITNNIAQYAGGGIHQGSESGSEESSIELINSTLFSNFGGEGFGNSSNGWDGIVIRGGVFYFLNNPCTVFELLHIRI